MKKVVIAPFKDSLSWHYVCHEDGLLEGTTHKDGEVIRIGYKTDDEGGLTRKQYQSLASIGLASCVTYGLSVDTIECVGVEWDEIVRRG